MTKRKGNYKTTPEHIVKKIRELFDSGLTKTQIHKQTGIALSVVCRYTPTIGKHMKDEDKARIAMLYAEGKTQIEIGAIVGFNRDTVARVTKTLPKRKKPHNQVFKPKKVAEKPIPKPKKLKTVIKKGKPDNSGKDVNVVKLPTKVRPPVYKRIRIDDKTEYETYSREEYEEKLAKYSTKK